MPAGGVVVEGADRFASTLRQFGEDLASLDAAHAAAGASVAAAGRNRVRRASGALAASVNVTVTNDGADIGSPLVYAPVQEYGWRAHSISPSYALTSAFADSEREIADIYAGAIDAALGKVKGR